MTEPRLVIDEAAATRLAAQVGNAANEGWMTLRQGTITAVVSASTKITVTALVNGVSVSGIVCLTGWFPTVGMNVWIADFSGGRWLAIGSTTIGPVPLGRRNLLDNGQFKVHQRDPVGTTGITVVSNTTVPTPADRWGITHGILSTGNCVVYGGYPVLAEIDTTSMNHLIIQNGTLMVKTPLVTTDHVIIRQGIEGFQLQELQWGTSAAKPVTLTLKFISTVAGTFIAELQHTAGTKRISRPIPMVVGRNRVSVTFPGLTTSSPANDSLAQLYLLLWLAAGPTFNDGNPANLNQDWSSSAATNSRAAGCTNMWATSGQQFNLIEAQLEPGSVATPIDCRRLADEIRDCHRYLVRFSAAEAAQAYLRYAYGVVNSTTSAYVQTTLPEKMRATPASVVWSGNLSTTAGVAVTSMTYDAQGSGPLTVSSFIGVASGLTVGQAIGLISNANTSSYMEVSSEIL